MAERSTSHASLRAAREKANLAGKRGVVDEVHERYSQFGDQVVHAILSFSLRPGGMRAMLNRLSMSGPSKSPDQMHLQITRYLINEGAAKFLKKISVDPQSVVTKSGNKDDVVEKTTESTVKEEPQPEASGGWVWEDRRSGHERRCGRDRRAELDVVFKNRRYGGERRSGVDRRQKQFPPPWPK